MRSGYAWGFSVQGEAVDETAECRHNEHMDRSAQVDQAHLHRRERQASEMILGNAALRSELTDSQAERLLQWALKHVERVVARTAKLPDDDAQPVIDKIVSAVTGVMRHVNSLPFTLDGMPTAEAAAVIDDLLSHLDQLQGVSEHALAQLQTLHRNCTGMKPAIVFEWLMLIIDTDVK